jgi:hypothetical protein
VSEVPTLTSGTGFLTLTDARRSGVFPGAFKVDDEDQDGDSLPPRTEEPSSMPASPTETSGGGESSKMGAKSTNKTL